jgi:rubrerythrin
VSTYGLPPLATGSRLHAVLEASLPASRADADPIRWDAAFLGLDRSRLFRRLSDTQQRAVLASASDDLLSEAWRVEQAGLLFTARMVTLAPTHHERALYASFAGDEARHLAALTPWLRGDASPPTPFHLLLAEVIERASRPVLVLIVQVVLEGWGLRHYRDLARAARHPALAEAFHTILVDEARHHGAGALLVVERPPTDEVIDEALPYLRRLLDMVRAGPLGLVAAVETATGPLSPPDHAALLDDLDALAHTTARLDLLRGLLRPTPALVARLDQGGHLRAAGATP